MRKVCCNLGASNRITAIRICHRISTVSKIISEMSPCRTNSYPADCRLAPFALLCNDVSHWMGASLESVQHINDYTDSSTNGVNNMARSWHGAFSALKAFHERNSQVTGWRFFVARPVARVVRRHNAPGGSFDHFICSRRLANFFDNFSFWYIYSPRNLYNTKIYNLRNCYVFFTI